MMSITVVNKNSISDQEIANNGTRNAAKCCSSASSELKLYQAFIFSVPILFTFILLILFYWFYLRRRRADWSSLRMRTSNSSPVPETIDELSRCEMGVKKELREMLPIIVFNQSFSVKDTQCSVCLGDYQGEDRLQQIPGCGHTFHIDCIDLWLTTHTTCPLCRQSLLASTKHVVEEADTEASDSQNSEDPQTSAQPTESGSGDERVVSDEVVKRASTKHVVEEADTEASDSQNSEDPQTSAQPTESGSGDESVVADEVVRRDCETIA